jgi:REP element-mobilizing transposase RayT
VLNRRSLTLAVLGWERIAGIRDCICMSSTAYLITFGCYGQWLPGENGAIDRRRNVFGTRLDQPNDALTRRSRQLMKAGEYRLDGTRREIVLSAIKSVCEYRGWHLFAAHVRATHVHVVVGASTRPEDVMRAFKAYASRELSLDPGETRRWMRHGSTRYLWTRAHLNAAIHYVVCEQGEAMACVSTEPRV